MSQSESEMYPLGCLNMGLAHGLAGVGCILAYAHIKGYSNEASLSALQKKLFLFMKSLNLKGKKTVSMERWTCSR